MTRHLRASPLQQLELGSPEYLEGRKLLARLVPFATDRKSAKIYQSLSDLTTDLWSRFDVVGFNSLRLVEFFFLKCPEG